MTDFFFSGLEIFAHIGQDNMSACFLNREKLAKQHYKF